MFQVKKMGNLYGLLRIYIWILTRPKIHLLLRNICKGVIFKCVSFLKMQCSGRMIYIQFLFFSENCPLTQTLSIYQWHWCTKCGTNNVPHREMAFSRRWAFDRCWGSFNNYVDQIYPILTTYPPRVDNCGHFTHFPSFVHVTKHELSTDLVHIVIEWPLGLAARAAAVAWIDFRTMPN